MRGPVLAVVSTAAALLLPPGGGRVAAGPDAPSPSRQASSGEAADPRATAVARRTLRAMGGEAAFGRLRTLRFDFVVEREGKEAARFRHAWDRHDGRYRVDGNSRDGRGRTVLFNVNDPSSGRSWTEGREEFGEALEAALRWAYGRFINDTYWLLMPAKLLDPGVRLAWEGEEFGAGGPASDPGGAGGAPGETRPARDILRVTFAEGVGLTPGDTYWAYVSRSSGLMERWEFVLEGRDAGERGVFLWEDWRSVGGVRLSLEKRSPDGSVRILFENVAGSPADDEAAFAPPVTAATGDGPRGGS